MEQKANYGTLPPPPDQLASAPPGFLPAFAFQTFRCSEGRSERLVPWLVRVPYPPRAAETLSEAILTNGRS